MPIRVVSACLILFLGLSAAQHKLGPAPSAAELRVHDAHPAAIGSDYGTSELLCEIESPDVCESSGLVRCANDPKLLWTHNDSGGAASIVAFDRDGKIHGVVAIEGAVNRDWEEIAAFMQAGEPWLILADCGNNMLNEEPATLYFVREPAADAVSAPSWLKIEVRFESGARNCEAVAIDPVERLILFVTKVASGRCEVFAAPIPEIGRDTMGIGRVETIIARRIAAPEISQATGMCLSADGRRLVIVNYQRGFEYCRATGETWETVFSRAPNRIDLSWRMPQREAVCFDEDDRSLLMTSEARQGIISLLTGASRSNKIPLWRVPAKAATGE